jgi:alpha-L-fucosidase
MGPDVRWVGTESGYGRQTEWSVLPGSNMSQEKIAANSQQSSGDGAFIPRDLMEEDLGSRAIINNASSLTWYPAEIDVSIRPGWFYKKDEDGLVKDPYKLMDIYYNSVGLNGVLLLNIPPDKRGLINDADIASLKGFRYLHDETFEENIAGHAKAESSSGTEGHSASKALDGNPETYWQPSFKDTNSSLILNLDNELSFNTVMLQENILVGQRMEKFHLEYWNGKKWINFANATTIGYKRLLRFPEVTTNKVKLVIDKSRLNPAVGSFGLYLAPPEVSFNPDNSAFESSIMIELKCDQKDSKIFYTVDGSEPNENSYKYEEPILSLIHISEPTRPY